MKAALPKRDKIGPQGRKRDCASGGMALKGPGPGGKPSGPDGPRRRLRRKRKNAPQDQCGAFFISGSRDPETRKDRVSQ